MSISKQHDLTVKDKEDIHEVAKLILVSSPGMKYFLLVLIKSDLFLFPFYQPTFDFGELNLVSFSKKLDFKKFDITSFFTKIMSKWH